MAVHYGEFCYMMLVMIQCLSFIMVVDVVIDIPSNPC